MSTTNTFYSPSGFVRLVAIIGDLMHGADNLDTAGITMHRGFGWQPTSQPDDLDYENEVAVIYKRQIVEWVGDFEFDTLSIAEWIRDNAVEWILGKQRLNEELGVATPGLTRSEIEQYLE